MPRLCLPCLLFTCGASACAPLSSFRPASGLMDGRALEIGAGGTAVAPRPYVDEPVQAAGQLWVTGRPGKRVTTSGIAAFEPEALALGGALRLDALRTDRFVLGPEVELGLFFGAVNLGAALRVFDQSYVYTAPRFGSRGSTWALDIPVGLSARIYEGLMLRPEYRFTWTGELSYYQRRDMLGVGLAVQF